MNIAHTESSMHLGGQELRILDQIQWLLKKGHSAWLLAHKASAIYGEALRRDIPVHPVPFRGSAHPRALFEIVRFVKRKQIQLIDCHSSSDACTAIAARLFGIPIVRTLHVYDFKTDIVHKYLWLYGNNRIIVVSRLVADMLVKYGFADPLKISVIPTGIDLSRFGPDVDDCAIRRKFNLGVNATVITNIAMIRPDKGLQFFVRAVDKISDTRPDVRYLIVGSATKPEYLEDIKNEIAALHHRDKVILTGFRQDVEKVIAASDVIVNSAYYEPMSQVIHQAFAMKKLVVASDIDGHVSTIRDHETGFMFHSMDAESLAQTILSVLDYDTQQIRDQAYQMALAEFGLNAMMEKTVKIYRAVLDEKRHGA